jgi:hypothetical protein
MRLPDAISLCNLCPRASRGRRLSTRNVQLAVVTTAADTDRLGKSMVRNVLGGMNSGVAQRAPGTYLCDVDPPVLERAHP